MADSKFPEELMRVRANLIQKYCAGDVDGVCNIYAEDCTFIAPGKPVVNSREELKPAVEGLFASGLTKLMVEFEEAVITGPEWAFSRGKVTFATEDGTPVINGRYHVGYKRDAQGQFRIYVDVFNYPE